MTRGLLLLGFALTVGCGGKVFVDPPGSGGGDSGDGGGRESSGAITGLTCQEVFELAADKVRQCTGQPVDQPGQCTPIVRCSAVCLIALDGCDAFLGDPEATKSLTGCLSGC